MAIMASTMARPMPLKMGNTGLTWPLVCFTARGKVEGGP
jgi:hypothetical protein